jgi:hypothetical protein
MRERFIELLNRVLANFEKGRVVKTTYHHGRVLDGPDSKENWDIFFDPDAPEYTSTADLPALFLTNELRQLG